MAGAEVGDKKYGDILSARVDDDPMRFISFGDQEFIELSTDTEKVIGDALVDEGAEAPKPCLLPVEVRRLIFAADGLLPTCSTSKTLRAIFKRPRKEEIVRQLAG